MRALLLAVCVVLVLVSESLACTLTWNANVEPDLAGYRVYTSSISGAYGAPKVQVGKVTTVDCGPETDGQIHYFQITAMNTTGRESLPSNEVSKLFAQVVTPPPGSSASVQTLVTDATGANVTFVGLPQILEFQMDSLPAFTAVPGFVPNVATFRHNIAWPNGTTFVCYHTKGTDGVMSASACAPVSPVVVVPPKDKLRVTSDGTNAVVIQYDAVDCPKGGPTRTTTGTTTKTLTLACK